MQSSSAQHPRGTNVGRVRSAAAVSELVLGLLLLHS
jgi:hypothetical protein